MLFFSGPGPHQTLLPLPPSSSESKRLHPPSKVSKHLLEPLSEAGGLHLLSAHIHLLMVPLMGPLKRPQGDTLAASQQSFSVLQQEENRLLLQVKQEKVDRDDCNLDLKVEVNISSECSLSSGECLRLQDMAVHLQLLTHLVCRRAQRGLDPVLLWLLSWVEALLLPKAVCPSVGAEPCEELPSETLVDGSISTTVQGAASPPGASVGLSCGPWARSRSSSLLLLRGGPPVLEAPAGLTDEALKSEGGADSGSGGGLAPPEELPSQDLPWMQERLSHLGAAYAAQLGPGTTQAAVPAQGGAECLEAPPTMLFTGTSHHMAAFSASFDMAPAAAAPPPPPPPTSTNHRGSSASKEPLVCAVCGRMFASGTTLKLHQRVHSGERPFPCPHCGKGFAQPSNLRVHLLIHTGERRYRCTLCGKSFLSSSHLKRHRTVHTQEKPYSCSRCGQAFSQMCSVRRHRQQSQCGL